MRWTMAFGHALARSITEEHDNRAYIHFVSMMMMYVQCNSDSTFDDIIDTVGNTVKFQKSAWTYLSDVTRWLVSRRGLRNPESNINTVLLLLSGEQPHRAQVCSYYTTSKSHRVTWRSNRAVRYNVVQKRSTNSISSLVASKSSFHYTRCWVNIHSRIETKHHEQLPNQ